jgi:hypothetical protein
MQRLFCWLVACLVSSAMVFGQGKQSPVISAAQPNTLHTNPNSNGANPPTTQGRAIRAPSTPNQELPGNSNPANATTGGAGTNGQAMRPNSSQSGTPGTGAGNTPNGRDTADNGIKRNGAGKSPVNGSGQIPVTNRGIFTVVQWFWIALVFVVGLIVIGVLASRRRAREEVDFRDRTPRIRTLREDDQRRNDEIRRVG